MTHNIPRNYNRIISVDNMEALVPHFPHGVNCKVWPRKLNAEFNALAHHFKTKTGRNYDQFDHARLQKEMGHMHGAAKAEAAFVLSDIERLHDEFGVKAVLRATKVYGPGGAGELHADYATQFGAGYAGPVTAWARNDQVQRLGETDFKLMHGFKMHAFHHGNLWVQGGITACRSHAFVHQGPPAPEGGNPRLVLIGYLR